MPTSAPPTRSSAWRSSPGHFNHVVVFPCARLRRLRRRRAGLPALRQARGARPRATPPLPIANPIDQRRCGADDEPRLGVLDRARAPASSAWPRCWSSTISPRSRWRCPACTSGASACKSSGGEAQPDGAIALLGPGTGMGVSRPGPGRGIAGRRWPARRAATSTSAPNDERELKVLQHAWKHLPHVSAERLISGPGIELIHEALTTGTAQGVPAPHHRRDRAARPGRQGRPGQRRRDRLLLRQLLGSFASNLALTRWAPPARSTSAAASMPAPGRACSTRSQFRARFEAKAASRPGSPR